MPGQELLDPGVVELDQLAVEDSLVRAQAHLHRSEVDRVHFDEDGRVDDPALLQRSVGVGEHLDLAHAHVVLVADLVVVDEIDPAGVEDEEADGGQDDQDADDASEGSPDLLPVHVQVHIRITPCVAKEQPSRPLRIELRDYLRLS